MRVDAGSTTHGVKEKSPLPYESLVDDYLSKAHRNHPGPGCPISALAGDLARSNKRTRALVTRKIREDIELLATLIRDRYGDKGTARSQAVSTYLRARWRH